jgi:serine/threonine protein kinase
LKLDNVLINKINETGAINVKIADFGLSTYGPPNPKDKLFEKCGTPCYAAPEILRGEGYTSKCDIFSIGSIFFNLVSGRYLFPGANKE